MQHKERTNLSVKEERGNTDFILNILISFWQEEINDVIEGGLSTTICFFSFSFAGSEWKIQQRCMKATINHLLSDTDNRFFINSCFYNRIYDKNFLYLFCIIS